MRVVITRDISKKYRNDTVKIINALINVVREYLDRKNAKSYQVFLDVIDKEIKKKIQNTNMFIKQKEIMQFYDYKNDKMINFKEKDKYIIVFYEDKMQKFAKVAKGHRVEFILLKSKNCIEKITVNFYAYKRLHLIIQKDGKVKTNIKK